MSLIFHILLSVLLVLAFFQDWKFRAITWFVFPLLAIVTLLIFWQLSLNWNMIGLNLIFVTLLMMTLFLYVSVREKKWTNIFIHHFGIGDVLFFVVVTPLFGNENFVLFFISGMILSGIFHLIISRKVSEKTIPLAGYLAVYILLLKGSALITKTDFFYTTLLG